MAQSLRPGSGLAACLLAAIGLSLPPAVQAQHVYELDYRRIADGVNLKYLFKVSPQTYPDLAFRLRLSPLERALSLEGSTLEILAAATPISLRLDRFGSAAVPISAALYRENPPVRITVPAKVGLQLGVEVHLKRHGADGVAVAQLEQGRRQYQAAMREAGWWVARLAPSLQRVVIRMPAGPVVRCQLEPVSVQGAGCVSNAQGECRLRLADLAASPAGRVTCQREAAAVLLEAE
ncbi:hypothetical protein [Chromobacterium haemolyticum]|uniref:hypothetical protein n=1 Tax=Chromobacterium haemolyticum TaxID=394935 RepID=UPI0009DAFB2D|nr:hypothetical protein [Chromobacterium haemolyticum]OQS35933.1 hypothetical protein B0T39_17325 [Chromobacterium haemolyticum]